MAKPTFSKMKPNTMLVVGAVLVLILPLTITGYITTNNPALLVGAMLGILTFPIGAVMLYVGFATRNKNK